MYKVKKIFVCVLSLLLFTKVNATHLMGGEITWECQGNGQYIFMLKLYRDCNGNGAPDPVTLKVFNNPLLDSINLALFSKKDISPTCNAAGPAISCKAAESDPNWPNSSNILAGAVEESVFKSAPITLKGVPPTKGWIFTYAACCRNGSINNIQTPFLYGFTLRAVMHAYSGKDAGPCMDSSPTFLESPSSVICVGSPFTYNHNASDPDLDSLSYSWAEPLSDLSKVFNPPVDPVLIPFNTGYSYNSPLPGTSQHPSNVPATINAATGEISFTSFTMGYFVTVVKVEAWKCGQLVAEIYREMQIVLLPCGANNKPNVTFTSYKDTVEAGELVSFTINGNDNDVLMNGTTPQTLTITATGTQFGAGFTNTAAGCLNPPCATLTPPAPVSALTNVSTNFSWQTGCNHISSNAACSVHPNTYTFVFKTQDDFCPASSQNISTVSITVLAPPVVLSPLPKCTAVLPNGDVTITWAQPVNKAGTFNSYQIYTAASATGPYKLLDSVTNYTQTTYTHVGANANAAPVYYYIQTRSGCGGKMLSPVLDTINTIFLKVVNPGDGTADLKWNNIAAPPISTSTKIYNVFMEYPAGTWKLVGKTTGTHYMDTVFVCNTFINYRIEIADSTGCTSVSSIAGADFKNLIVPVTPLIDTLSVDDNNKIILSWNKASSPDVNAYIIYHQLGTSSVPIDTVKGINTLTFNYPPSTPDKGVDSYLIAALDSCGNIGLLGAVYSTIFVKPTADICARSVILNWTAYPVIGTGLAGYRIYQSTVGNAGPFTLVGTVAASVLTYTVPGLTPGINYYYKIQAVDLSGTKTASSNRIVFYSSIPVPPKFSYLKKVTVTASNTIDVICHVDAAASSRAYKIMRSESVVPLNYVEIGNVTATKSTPVQYTDNSVLTDTKSYFYKIINVDSCGFDGLETNIGRSILLTAVSNNENLTNQLTWNDYELWSGTVMSYNIYRGIDGIMDPVPIANIPFTGMGENKYVDDISTQLSGQGIFSYYVEALEGIGNVYGFSENSISNVAEAYQDPMVYIPNAFVPHDEGNNQYFIPVTTFVDFTDYEFSIFDRWGKQLFMTKEVSKGWDGSFNGKPCAIGVYIYLVRYKTAKGEYLQYKGSVTLLR